MKKNPVGWFEIYVTDMKRARTFYETVLGTKLDKLESPAGDMSEMWTFPMEMGAAGAGGALCKMDGGPAGSGNSVIIYFMCDDCANEAKKAAANGGKIMKDKMSIGQYGFIALVTDPEGNVIGLHSMK